MNDFPPEAITLISALASFLGGEIVVKKFLDRYIELCSDLLLHVRKVFIQETVFISNWIFKVIVQMQCAYTFKRFKNSDL